ncbi:MAG: hypothetical protein AB7I41_10300 [Candidatus Sericytochromatia bacterium]
MARKFRLAACYNPTMNLNPALGPANYGLEVAPELRKQPVERLRSAPDPERKAAEKLLPAGRLEKEGSFVHSLGFVENVPPEPPKQFKHGVPVVQRLSLNWL